MLLEFLKIFLGYGISKLSYEEYSLSSSLVVNVSKFLSIKQFFRLQIECISDSQTVFLVMFANLFNFSFETNQPHSFLQLCAFQVQFDIIDHCFIWRLPVGAVTVDF